MTETTVLRRNSFVTSKTEHTTGIMNNSKPLWFSDECETVGQVKGIIQVVYTVQYRNHFLTSAVSSQATDFYLQERPTHP